MTDETQIDATDSKYGTVHLYRHLDPRSLCGKMTRTPSVHLVWPSELDWDEVCGTCERAYRARQSNTRDGHTG